MIIHISLDGLGAIHAEWALAYGRSPAWKMSRFGREVVLDIPFARIIITPLGSKAGNDGEHKETTTYFFNRVGWNSDDETKRPPGPDSAVAGITEN